MTDAEIVDALAKTDPVYEQPGGHRKCALCRAVGQKNAENVAHEAGCPWIPAIRSRDPYGPGGKWDSRKCRTCGELTVRPQDSSGGLCPPCKDAHRAKGLAAAVVP